MQSTCGCTVAKYPTDPILPGKSSNIEVTYSPTGRPGPFEKAVWVYTNTKPNRTRLVIKGSVIGSSESVKRYYPIAAGDLQFTALTLPLGETKKGLMPSTSTTAYNTGNDTIVLSFDNNTSHITYDAIPDTIPPGQISTTTFFFDSNRTPVWGINDDYITIIATPLHSNNAASKIKVNIIGNVVLFIPSGIILPVLYRSLRRLGKAVSAGAALSLCIELLQLPVSSRATDIDDLILNTLGCAIGYGIYVIFKKMFSWREKHADIQP